MSNIFDNGRESVYVLQQQWQMSFKVNGFFPELFYLIVGDLIKKHGDLGWHQRLCLGNNNTLFLDLSNLSQHKKYAPIYTPLIHQQRKTPDSSILISQQYKLGAVYPEDSLLDALAQVIKSVDKKYPTLSAAYLRAELARSIFLEEFESHLLKKTLQEKKESDFFQAIENQRTLIMNSFCRLPFFAFNQNNASLMIKSFITNLDQLLNAHGFQIDFDALKDEIWNLFYKEFTQGLPNFKEVQIKAIFQNQEELLRSYISLSVRFLQIQQHTVLESEFENKFSNYKEIIHTLSDLNQSATKLFHLDREKILPTIAQLFKLKIVINDSIAFGSDEAPRTVKLMFDENESIYYPVLPVQHLDDTQTCKQLIQKNPVKIDIPDVLNTIFTLTNKYLNAPPEYINLKGNTISSKTIEMIQAVINKQCPQFSLVYSQVLDLPKENQLIPSQKDKLTYFEDGITCHELAPIGPLFNQTVAYLPSRGFSVSIRNNSIESNSTLLFLLNNTHQFSLVIDIQPYQEESIRSFLNSIKPALIQAKHAQVKLSEIILLDANNAMNSTVIPQELWELLVNELDINNSPTPIKVVFSQVTINNQFFDFFTPKNINELVLFRCRLASNEFSSKRKNNTELLTLRIHEPLFNMDVSMEKSLNAFIKEFPELKLLHFSHLHVHDIHFLLDLNRMPLSHLIIDQSSALRKRRKIADIALFEWDSHIQKGFEITYRVGQHATQSLKQVLFNHLRINLFDPVWRIISTKDEHAIKQLIQVLNQYYILFNDNASQCLILNPNDTHIIQSLSITLNILSKLTSNIFIVLHIIKSLDEKTIRIFLDALDQNIYKENNKLSQTIQDGIGRNINPVSLASQIANQALAETYQNLKPQNIAIPDLRKKASELVERETSCIIYNLRKRLYDELDQCWFNPANQSLRQYQLPHVPLLPNMNTELDLLIMDILPTFLVNSTIPIEQISMVDLLDKNDEIVESQDLLSDLNKQLEENVEKIKKAYSDFYPICSQLCHWNDCINYTLDKINSMEEFQPISHISHVNEIEIIDLKDIQSIGKNIFKRVQAAIERGEDSQGVMSQIVNNYLAMTLYNTGFFLERTLIPKVTISKMMFRVPIADPSFPGGQAQYLTPPAWSYDSQNHLTFFRRKSTMYKGDMVIETEDHNRKRPREEGTFCREY